jgi:hypothetical protein
MIDVFYLYYMYSIYIIDQILLIIQRTYHMFD